MESSPIPSVELAYKIPGTEITAGPAAVINTTSVQFQVESTEPHSSFECSLDGSPFALCASPVQLTGLAQGAHTFRVRAINTMDNFDPTPAAWQFRIDSIAPVTTIDSGPSGATRLRRPEFRFSSPEPGVTFSCRFDAAEFASCAEPGAEIPASALDYGPHVFAVRATDPTGNVGPAATRSFEVIDPDVPPEPQPLPPPERRSTATMKLGRPKVKPRRGTAVLPVTVSANGRLALRGSGRIKPRARPVRGPATLRLKITARGKTLRKLRRKGKAVVTARVTYRPEEGQPIERRKRVKLRLRR